MSDELSVVQVEWSKATPSLSQARSSGIEFAIIHNGKQITPWMLCKDFVHDIIYAAVNKKTVSIYGLNFDGKQHANFFEEKIDFVLRGKINKTNTKELFVKRMEAMIDFINQIEKDFGFKRTKLFNINYDKKESAALGFTCRSYKWKFSPPLISLYTLLVRIGFFAHEQGTNYNQTLSEWKKQCEFDWSLSIDKGMFNQIKDVFEVMREKHARGIFSLDMSKNYSEENFADVSNLHNNGICQMTHYPVTKWAKRIQKQIKNFNKKG